MTFKEIILSCLLSYKLVVSRLLSLSWMCTLIMAWPFPVYVIKETSQKKLEK